jgi:adenylosuccinate lyase
VETTPDLYTQEPPTMPEPLHLLSPLDGRYAGATAPLREHFSEFAFLRTRVQIELDYLSALSTKGLIRSLNDGESALLQSIQTGFSLADAEVILAFERQTRHDVKAIEYFLQSKLQNTSLQDLIPWIHFGLTSEDINSISQAIALRRSRDEVLLHALDGLIDALSAFARQHRAVPMLARTHGQFAVPTTLGKEIAFYLARLRKTREHISAHRFEAKLTGAVGNFNALHAAMPRVDWLSFSEEFIAGFGLQPNLVTTQILPYDNWIMYFDLLRLTNSILLDFAQDVWRYISDGWFKQSFLTAEVGSSTMPQKVNPIDFENAEGNLGLANSLLLHYAQKLPVSRLQRDLSDSTVRRTLGTALGHCLLAWANLQRGLGRIAPDESKLRAELNEHWEVVAEGAQTLLRAAGRPEAYESLKERTRGQVLSKKEYLAWCDSLDVGEETRKELRQLSPETYIGLAVQLTDRVLNA